MHFIDYGIIALYMLGVLAIGFWFFRRQTNTDEYFVGDRKMGAGHIGLSVVATDVGGGFSIGLGGVGFAIGISGSWLLFTGLVGAWMAAVLLIPRVKTLGDRFGWTTYPEYLEHRYDGRTRLLAAILSGVGYAGFVGAQILAGATLSAAAFEVDLETATWVMAGVVILYTAFGGLQAVVYTDTIQWAILLSGLLFLALPFAYDAVGGWDAIVAAAPEGHLSLTNLDPLTAVGWALTIIPIWFVGMTLYQRIYATRDVKTAKRAWYLAGLLEYPTMAFIGAALGTLARVQYPDLPVSDKELGLPMLLKDVLPIGVTGAVLAAYFSAIMSTADSCLLASVGNFVGDVYQRHINRDAPNRKVLALSRLLTVGIGLASVAMALLLPNVLDAILLAYEFVTAGLFAPTILGLLWKRVSAPAALASMALGGGTSVVLNLFPSLDPVGQPILLALPASFMALVVVTLLVPARDPDVLEVGTTTDAPRTGDR